MTRWFFMAAGLAAILSTLLVRWGYGEGYVPELAGAWVLTLLHGAAAFLIAKKAAKADTTDFFRLGLGLNAVRAMTLFAILFALHLAGMKNFEPFVAAVITGYFCYIFSEVWGLHQQSTSEG